MNISETENEDIISVLKTNYFNSEDEKRNKTAFGYILEQKEKFNEQNDQLTKAYKYLLRIIDDEEDFENIVSAEGSSTPWFLSNIFILADVSYIFVA